MRRAVLMLLAASSLMTLTVGCGSTSQVVRGQDPNDCEIVYGGGNTLTRYKGTRKPNGYAPLQGPEAPAIVQYPYYVVKGPDCFFHQ